MKSAHKLMAASVAFSLAILPAAHVAARKMEAPGQAEAISKVLDCRQIADSQQRLACFDEQTAAMASAIETKQVVVLDKKQVKETKKSLFGFSLPKLPFFGGKDDDDEQDEDAVREIEAKIVSVRGLGYGEFIFKLDNDSEWQTIESFQGSTPRSGTSIRIKRAALGSFRANIGGWPAIRIKRIG